MSESGHIAEGSPPATKARPDAPFVIAFDLDGTLIDTAPDLIATLNEILARHRVPPLPYDSAREMIGGGVKSLLEKGLSEQGRPFSPQDLDAVYREYLAHYSAHIADHSRPYPGLLDALDHLERQGFRLAVCTNKLESLSRQLLQALGLTDRFAAICGQDTFGTPKPHPDMLRKTVRMAGGDPNRSLMVGDSVTDIDTARAAGVPVIAVDFGYTPIPVTHFAPDRVISHFDELAAAVDALVPTP
jgi:phosphoglycolate phosphatase